ncbi:hypothetical protein TNCV_164171 [Trichonephila clavipes]|nr:hypothetical protein TNCV_164171 [Trichonephila clavipes]
MGNAKRRVSAKRKRQFLRQTHRLSLLTTLWQNYYEIALFVGGVRKLHPVFSKKDAAAALFRCSSSVEKDRCSGQSVPSERRLVLLPAEERLSWWQKAKRRNIKAYPDEVLNCD